MTWPVVVGIAMGVAASALWHRQGFKKGYLHGLKVGSFVGTRLSHGLCPCPKCFEVAQAMGRVLVGAGGDQRPS